jgi:hypothetical protein
LPERCEATAPARRSRDDNWRAATISTDAKFQRSLDGETSPICTRPFADEGVDVDCTQNVSPTCVSTRWWTSTWPLAGTRATARSQSLPTANTQSPAITPGR